MTKRPGPPSATATPCTQPRKRDISQSVDYTRLPRHTRTAVYIAAATTIIGAAAALHYSRLGLSLSHYDARAHLVVARRVLDSLTPGWQQIGAVWLPLPHVINMFPVQIDGWYRSGASAIAFSVASMGLAAGSLALMLLRVTGSLVAAATGAMLLMLNPNVLYLQSTPMTEPLLFGLTMLAISATSQWVDDFPRGSATLPGAALAAACLTRYEAWPITAAVVALAALVLLRRGCSIRAAGGAALTLAMWPALSILVFTLNSRWVVGEWFVSGGFFVAENIDAMGNPGEAWRQIDEGFRKLSGSALLWTGYIGAAAVVFEAIRSKARASLVLLLSLAAAAALPMLAYMQGHPFRLRYDVPLIIAATALGAGGLSLLPRRLQPVLAVALLVLTLREAPPLDRDAPLVAESQREATAMAGRRAVTDYLQKHHDDTTIMMSMGSLGHYMHDLSSIGLGIRDFLHEGNGKPWEFAMLGPAGRVRWIVIEEQAEGGDVLFRAAKRERWLNGFERVAEGGGAALYKATKETKGTKHDGQKPRTTGQ